jgi:hypothetical protein
VFERNVWPKKKKRIEKSGKDETTLVIPIVVFLSTKFFCLINYKLF